MDHDIVSELPLDECWDLLRAHAMGAISGRRFVVDERARRPWLGS